jgi:hypothetical protein
MSLRYGMWSRFLNNFDLSLRFLMDLTFLCLGRKHFFQNYNFIPNVLLVCSLPIPTVASAALFMITVGGDPLS